MFSSKRLSRLLGSCSAIALLAVVGSDPALAQDQTISTSQSSTVTLTKPGTTVLVAPGVTINPTASGAHGIQGNLGDTWIITNDGAITPTGNGSRGIFLQGTGSAVINNGTINGPGGDGVRSSTDLSVTNNLGASINGVSVGVGAGGPLTIRNAGSITGGYAANGSFSVSGTGADIVNSGLMQGTYGSLYLTNSTSIGIFNTIHNLAGGSIISTGTATSAGIYILHGYTVLTNDAGATVRGSYYGIAGNDLFTFLEVDNTGLIQGDSASGIRAYGGAVVTNRQGGTITGAGGLAFVRSIFGNVDLTNAGTITGTGATFIGGNGSTAGSGAGVYVGGASGSGWLRNQGTGRIEGTVYGIYTGPAAQPADAAPMMIINEGTITGQTGISVNGGLADITNSGTIAGTNGTAIQFAQTGSFNNTLTLDTGSVLTGNVLGGPGNDALILLGSNSEDISKFQNFETLAMQGTNWTLTGAGSFSTSATVLTGRLGVEGTLTAPTVTVQTTGNLGGSGTIVGNVSNAGTLSPGGENTAGTLNITGNLSLAGNSILHYQLAQPGVAGGALNDLINVSGNLVLGGTLNVTASSGRSFAPGIYRLINYGGTLTDNGLTIGTLPAGAVGSIQTAIAGQVNLVNVGGLVLNYWDGDAGPHGDGTINGGNGTWQGPGGNNNWTDSTGTFSASYANGSYAVFAGAAGTVTVDNGSNVTVAGMQFATDGYLVQGAPITLLAGVNPIRVGDGTAAGAGITAQITSELAGSGTLNKADEGTLILSGTNTYTGGTILESGVLQVSRDANLGAASGGLTFDGGTLHTTAGFDSARTIDLQSTGQINVDAGTTLGLSGAITGAADLYKQGAGTLTLTGTNSYGNTLVAAGTLIGNSASISGHIRNAATVVFDQTADGAFAGNITGLSGVAGTMVKQGSGTLTLGGVSTLDWSVRQGRLVSAAGRFRGDATIGAGATLAFDQASNARYGGVISGTGTFEKAGSGTVTLAGDSSGFLGTTNINGGTLFVDVEGRLGGLLNVRANGTLAGSGTVGTTVVYAGGTLSPGRSSTGTLTINGDLTFQSGSQFAVDLTPSDADRVNVSGQATLEGGTVAVTKVGGVYLPGSRWTILNASGGVSGSFATLAENLPYVGLLLRYDANNVYLDITRNNTAFCLSGFTFNQCSAAGGVESLGQSNALYAAVASQVDAGAAARAFDQLSGEVHASAKSVFLDDSRYVRDAMNERLRGAFDAVGAARMPVFAYASSGGAPSLAPADTAGPAFWVQGFGAWGSFDGDGNAARLTRSTGGFFAGVDALAADTWRIGVLGGYSRTNFNVNDRFSSGSSDNYHVGLYAGTEWGNLAFRSGAAYTWHEISTGRSVVFPGFQDRLTADYSARTAQIFGELAYRIDAGVTPIGAVAFEPFANLAYVNLDTSGFTERGQLAALTSRGTTDDATFTTLGLRVASSFTFDNGVNLVARGMLGWRHAFGDVAPLASFAFAGGNTFDIAGVPIARDAAVVSAGLDVVMSKSLTIGLSYTGQIASSQRDNAVKANLNWRF